MAEKASILENIIISAMVGHMKMVYTSFWPEYRHSYCVLKYWSDLNQISCPNKSIFAKKGWKWLNIGKHQYLNNNNNALVVDISIVFLQPLLAKIGYFRLNIWLRSIQNFKNAIEMWIFWSKWGVNHFHTTHCCRDNDIFSYIAIFSHFWQ